MSAMREWDLFFPIKLSCIFRWEMTKATLCKKTNMNHVSRKPSVFLFPCHAGRPCYVGVSNGGKRKKSVKLSFSYVKYVYPLLKEKNIISRKKWSVNKIGKTKYCHSLFASREKTKKRESCALVFLIVNHKRKFFLYFWQVNHSHKRKRLFHTVVKGYVFVFYHLR